MEWAILIVAAAAAIAGVALPEWRRRPQVTITFDRNRFHGDSSVIKLWFRVENTGQALVPRVDLYRMVAADAPVMSLGQYRLESGEWIDEAVELAVPELAEMSQQRPVLKAAVGVWARAGKHEWKAWHPDSPAESDPALVDAAERME